MIVVITEEQDFDNEVGLRSASVMDFFDEHVFIVPIEQPRAKKLRGALDTERISRFTITVEEESLAAWKRNRKPR